MVKDKQPHKNQSNLLFSVSQHDALAVVDGSGAQQDVAGLTGSGVPQQLEDDFGFLGCSVSLL